MAEKPHSSKPSTPAKGPDSTVRLDRGSIQLKGEGTRRLLGVVIAVALFLAAVVVVWQTLRSAGRVGANEPEHPAYAADHSGACGGVS